MIAPAKYAAAKHSSEAFQLYMTAGHARSAAYYVQPFDQKLAADLRRFGARLDARRRTLMRRTK